MKLPSKRLNVTVDNLHTIAQNTALELARKDVGFKERLIVEAVLANQSAIVERLDGLLELVEHVLVHHLQKNPPPEITQESIDIDDIIRGETSDGETQPDA